MFNDYRGSTSTHAYPLPVPYVIYRGSFLRSDRDGVHGLLFNHRYLEIELSVNATAPTRIPFIRPNCPLLREASLPSL